jgi:hypothetical protein
MSYKRCKRVSRLTNDKSDGTTFPPFQSREGILVPVVPDILNRGTRCKRCLERGTEGLDNPGILIGGVGGK